MIDPWFEVQRLAHRVEGRARRFVSKRTLAHHGDFADAALARFRRAARLAATPPVDVAPVEPHPGFLVSDMFTPPRSRNSCHPAGGDGNPENPLSQWRGPDVSLLLDAVDGGIDRATDSRRCSMCARQRAACSRTGRSDSDRARTSGRAADLILEVVDRHRPGGPEVDEHQAWTCSPTPTVETRA